MWDSPSTLLGGAAELLSKAGAHNEAHHAYEIAIGLERGPELPAAASIDVDAVSWAKEDGRDS
jgi:hypothetical protein